MRVGVDAVHVAASGSSSDNSGDAAVAIARGGAAVTVIDVGVVVDVVAIGIISARVVAAG